MSKNISNKQKQSSIEQDRRRRKREVILICIIIVIVSLLAFAESRIIHFGTNLPVSNTVLMFILINVNLLLAILLIYLVFRNLVKLLYDRKRKVIGAKLRTRLVVAFISLTLLPTIVLFLFSMNFITTSMEFWFKVPVEQSLEKSLSVGRSIYERIENNNQFFMERIAYQIKTKKLLTPGKDNALSNYIQVVQRAFNFDAVEVYSANSKRLMLAISPELKENPFKEVSADDLIKKIIPDSAWSITEKINKGELVKTIGTIPFGAKPDNTLAFVVVTTMILPDLSESMESISRGFEEYQQIKLLKKPIQITYYISLSIVAFLVLFCAIWFGFYMAKSISIPIKELAEGARRVAEGELSFSIDPVADDEIGSLVEAFNKMTKDLRVGREQLELSTLML
ncbi:MAG: HAMP domain-containing protein, partial [Deltaproteobacteria bacterium]|nr:HAMP domain-containing protein [Deltaproteobacteria bacterium]